MEGEVRLNVEQTDTSLSVSHSQEEKDGERERDTDSSQPLLSLVVLLLHLYSLVLFLHLSLSIPLSFISLALSFYRVLVYWRVPVVLVTTSLTAWAVWQRELLNRWCTFSFCLVSLSVPLSRPISPLLFSLSFFLSRLKELLFCFLC